MKNVRETIKGFPARLLTLMGSAVEQTQKGLNKTANALVESKEPIRLATESGLKLNAIGYNTMAKVVKLNAKAVEGTLDAAAERLETAASAEDAKSLVKGQTALLSKTRKRMTQDLKKGWDIAVETKNEVVDLGKETVSDFRTYGQETFGKDKETVEEAVEQAA